jgi:very-short-patch-repair endonuclease
VTEVQGIAVTTPARTIFDLAGDPAVHPGRVERVLDTAWARRLVTYRSLHQMLHSLAKRGRPGIGVMRSLLADRPVDYRPPESGLESRFRQLLSEAGLPPMERQVDVGDEAGWIGRVDFIDRANRVIVQIDSDLYHGSVLDQQRDATQTAALRAAGYVVVRIVEFDLWHRKDEVLNQLRALRRAA